MYINMYTEYHSNWFLYLYLVPVVGFEQLEYSGDEGTSVEVCVVLNGTAEFAVDVTISLEELVHLSTASSKLLVFF